MHDWIGLPARRRQDRAPDRRRAERGGGRGLTSLNVFKALYAALWLRPDRRVILSDDGNFPTDLYMAQGLPSCRRQAPADNRAAGRDRIGADRGRRRPDADRGRLPHRPPPRHGGPDQGCARPGRLALWDLAHSAGAFPVDLNGCGADFAVGCGYKYLNGGRARRPSSSSPTLAGQSRAAAVRLDGPRRAVRFDLDYRPRAGIARFLVGTPPILSLAALEFGLDLFAEVDLAAVRRKSGALGDLFIALVEQELPAAASASLPRARRRSAGAQVPTGIRKAIPSCRP